MNEPKNLFFRVRENGAAVYRIDTENRQNRLDMQQIATANVRNGDVKPQGEQTPTAQERNQIEAWIVNRRKMLEVRRVDDIFRAVDHLNQTAQWVQSKATDKQVDEFADDFLLAMHDLRTVIVRRKSDILLNK